MVNPSYSWDIHALTEACGLLRLDPNYLQASRDSSNDDDDDDPLGRPEITVNINDDWTVSSEESRHALQDDHSEDSVQSNDEVNVDDNNLVTSFYNNVRTFPPRRKFSSDDEEHVVPSIIPTKVARLILDKKLTLSGTERELDSEEEKEEAEEGEEEREAEEKEEEDEEVEQEEEEGEEVSAEADLGKETTHRYHDDEETRDRSNPQPP